MPRIISALLLTFAISGIPNIGGEGRYGFIVQNGRGVSIDGPAWQALGRIREDGTLYLLWEYKADGRKAPSVYTIKGGEVLGWWGYEDQVEMLKDGTLKGTLMPDNLYND